MISPRWLVLASAVAPAGFVMGLALGAEVGSSSARFEQAHLTLSGEEESLEREVEQPEWVAVQVRVEFRGEVEGRQCLVSPSPAEALDFEQVLQEVFILIIEAVEESAHDAEVGWR